MKDKLITVEIDANGESTLDLEGFQGRGCADVADAFRGGGRVLRSETKREFYAEQKHAQRQSQRGQGGTE